MSTAVHVVGVGMVPFATPRTAAPYDEMAETAVRAALTDAGIGYDDLQQAYAGYVYGDSTSGQRALYRVGLTGIPIVNVNNNCSTGSTALWLARQAIASGAADCVLALGFEQMQRGALRDALGGPTAVRWTTSARWPTERRAANDDMPLAAAEVRRRWARVHRPVRDLAGDVREDLGQGAPARGQQPVRGVPRSGDGRGGARVAARSSVR